MVNYYSIVAPQSVRELLEIAETRITDGEVQALHQVIAELSDYILRTTPRFNSIFIISGANPKPQDLRFFLLVYIPMSWAIHKAALLSVACDFWSETRYQKNRSHPPELAVGSNTSTKFSKPNVGFGSNFRVPLTTTSSQESHREDPCALSLQQLIVAHYDSYQSRVMRFHDRRVNLPKRVYTANESRRGAG